MENIEFIKRFELGGEVETEKNVQAQQIYKGTRRQIMEIKLRHNAVLSKHKAAQPITIFCLAGKGKFLAGEDLGEELILETGTLITLDAETEHGAIAEPELHLLVTKFLDD
jgi:quercetin dioxygenase-like cupin family protein